MPIFGLRLAATCSRGNRLSSLVRDMFKHRLMSHVSHNSKRASACIMNAKPNDEDEDAWCCINCNNKDFNSLNAYLMHKEAVHGRSELQQNIVEWEKSRDQQGELTCTQKVLKHDYTVKDSWWDDDEEMWCCPDCDFQFDSSEQLHQHRRSGVHDAARYHCSECDNLFASFALLHQLSAGLTF